MGFFKRRTTPRPPVSDLEGTIEVGGRPLDLAPTLVAARVEGPGLQVSVYHPAFADLADEARTLAAYEILVATLGEEGLRLSVSQVSPATHPPIDPFGLEPLRTFVRSFGIPIEPA